MYKPSKNEHRKINTKYSALQSIMQSPKFVNNAISMYSRLDDTLTNINNLTAQQLKQRKRRKRKRSNTNNNDDNEKHENNENNKNHHNLHNDKHLELEQIDVNEHVVDVMKTLISSTTEISSFFSSSSSTTPSRSRNNGAMSPIRSSSIESSSSSSPSTSTSFIGRALDKLSSSIAYMSYISVSTITPYIYSMVEAVLIELYATIKDIIEYYDSDPKNNILWRIINKMNEIIEAIRGLLAL